MSYGEAQAVHAELTPLSQTREFLGRISAEQDINKQFIHASDTCLPERLDAPSFDAMIDFVTCPDSSPSLLVRASILDRAISAIYWSAPTDPELVQRNQELEELIPAIRDTQLIAMTHNPMNFYDVQDRHRWLRDVAYALVDQEGINEDIVFPDWWKLGFPSEYPDHNPYGAFMLLSRLNTLVQTGEQLPINRLSRLIPFALQVQEAAQAKGISISPSEKSDMEQQGRMTRFIDYGDDHQPQVEAIARASAPERAEYIRIFNGLYEAASALRSVFPAAVADRVSHGARELVASAIFAVNEHIRNGDETAIKLPLGNQQEALPLRLSGGEPLALLQALQSGMTTLVDVVDSPHSVTTQVTKASDYNLYRILDDVGGQQASVYVRPYGGYSYDPTMEYGRVTEGVEASISYVVDSTLSQAALLEVGRHRKPGPDNRVSIRLDREGVQPYLRGKQGITRDPAQEQGTLSLDVGSVLGDDEWLSTKIGRLLAWGDLLKHRARGQQTNLNHVTHYFTTDHGRAEVFAGMAHDTIRRLEERRTHLRTLAGLSLGAAVRHTD